MLRKLYILFRLALPFIINYLMFSYIYRINAQKEFALTDSLFYVGIISIVYGLAALFATRNLNPTGMLNFRNNAVNMTLSDQHIKNYHNGKKIALPSISIRSIHIKIIYIALGVLLCISGVIVNLI